MSDLTLIATSAFGLESVVGDELKRLVDGKPRVRDGRLEFDGNWHDVARCNLRLRCADRLLWKIAEFTAHDFGELFEQTKAIRWEDLLPRDAVMHVTGKSVRSKLHSVPDCQSIVKKGIIEAMKRRYTQEKFAEDGPLYKIEISMLADVATLTIDTSGPGLHKRGYRLAQNDAPLRETVAAAMLWIAHWKPERVLCDPCCGSGTIAIEAALAARNIAPGLGRSFTAEQWPAMPKEIWHEAREEARSLINFSKPEIYASDIDLKSCKIAENNARAAGVADNIIIQKKPLAEYSSKRKYGCLICNPPWGERMSEQKEVEVLSREIGQLMDKLDSWSYFILSGNEKFEAMCGKKASRNRKLYNGKLKTYLYQYLGPLPPRPPRDKPAAENQG